ncbi:unnamed protein product [Rhizoctonia solani]|uniref:Mitochondrial intermembrane space import and assembly protein 40 n=1 Tax=Rhizoctonia solani TaxID=456999 RepID=A0A8H3B0B0_9AGAM|nr:unnamed protein product [Rhizoctonia solani]
MFVTRVAARIPLRSPVLRRSIHSGARGNWGRSSAATVGLVVAAGAGAIGTYVSYKAGENKESNVGQNYSEARRPPTTKPAPESTSKTPTQKSQQNTSVDSQAPVKSSLSEPGVIEPSKDESAKAESAPGKECEPTPEGGMDDLEADAASQGAFNPETGEINWDCPCLGGMAHGPCGPQFREAFACFVHSNEEPKGVDCVEKFKAMQDCFREHPDVYGEELEDDDEASDVAKGPKSEEGTNDKPADDKGKEPEEGPETKTAANEDAPAPPNPNPESRTKAPTAKVSPEKTPSKSDTKH